MRITKEGNPKQEKKVVVSFAISKDILKDFDYIIEEFNKANGADFTRSQVLQMLVLNYNVKVGMDILIKNKNIKEEN